MKHLNDYNRLIQNSGLKKGFIAKQIGISRSMLYYFLNEQKNLSPEKLIKLKNILNKYKEETNV